MSKLPGLRLLFFGTPEFAVPSLRVLAESRHDVVGVISQPDRPRGRGRKLEPTPVRVEAERREIPVLQAEMVGEPEAVTWMREQAPDLGCVVAFGQFISRSVRDLPQHGLINAHASLLPRHRGAAPIQHAILCGDEHTGISVMRLEREMDAGDVCLVCETRIGAEETAGELSERLAALAAKAMAAAIERIALGRAEWKPQDPAAVTLAPKLERDFGHIDWSESREQVLRRIRTATPSPGADAVLLKSGARLRILAARAWEVKESTAPPGRIRVEDGRLGVAAADGWIELVRVQKAGGKPLEAAAYLRGAKLPAGEEAVTP